MFLVINKDYEHTIEVQSISRDMVTTLTGKKEFFINLVATDDIEATLEYCASFVNAEITNIELYEKNNDDSSFITSYSFENARVDSIREVVENGAREITVLIVY